MLADLLKNFNSVKSHASEAISSSSVEEASPEQQALADHWSTLLADHHVTKLKQEAKSQLKKNGLPFDEQTLKAILLEIFETTSCKIKRNALRPLSVIYDKKGTPYAIFRGILGKGAFGKVKLAMNLFTKQWCVVKICFGNTASEGEFLKKRNLLRGKQERDSKLGKKQYLFIDLLPGIAIWQFVNLLQQSKESLNQKQQGQCLYALLKALVNLMEAGIYHRDLHQGNMLIDPITWRSNIVDFGMASDISAEEDKDGYHAANLRSVLSFELVKQYITNPLLKGAIETLLATKKDVLLAIKQVMKAIKAGLSAESDIFEIAFKDLFKQAIEKNNIEIINFLLKNFPEKTIKMDYFNFDSQSLLALKDSYFMKHFFEASINPDACIISLLEPIKINNNPDKSLLLDLYKKRTTEQDLNNFLLPTNKIPKLKHKIT